MLAIFFNLQTLSKITHHEKLSQKNREKSPPNTQKITPKTHTMTITCFYMKLCGKQIKQPRNRKL